MEENKAKQPTMEEQLLKAMGMSLYGRPLESRCRVLTPAQRAEINEAAVTNLMQQYSIDREEAIKLMKQTNS